MPSASAPPAPRAAPFGSIFRVVLIDFSIARRIPTFGSSEVPVADIDSDVYISRMFSFIKAIHYKMKVRHRIISAVPYFPHNPFLISGNFSATTLIHHIKFPKVYTAAAVHP